MKTVKEYKPGSIFFDKIDEEYGVIVQKYDGYNGYNMYWVNCAKMISVSYPSIHSDQRHILIHEEI